MELGPIVSGSNERQKNIQVLQVYRIEHSSQCRMSPGGVGRLEENVSRASEQDALGGAIGRREFPDGRIQFMADPKQGLESVAASQWAVLAAAGPPPRFVAGSPHVVETVPKPKADKKA